MTSKPFDPAKYLTPEDMLDLLGEAYDEVDRLKAEVAELRQLVTEIRGLIG